MEHSVSSSKKGEDATINMSDSLKQIINSFCCPLGSHVLLENGNEFQPLAPLIAYKQQLIIMWIS
jgi:hypothetical protein